MSRRRRPKTAVGRFLRGVGGVALAAAATAFPVAGGVVQRSAAAFRAGVQRDRKNIERTHAQTRDFVEGGSATAKRFDAGTRLAGMWLWIQRNWYFLLIPVFLFVVFRESFFGRRSSGRRSSGRRSSGRRSPGVKVPIRRAKKAASRGAFRKTIHGKVFTSRRAWSAEMQRLRKK